MYNNPGLQDCSHALAALPQVDRFYRYYVEPQLETAPPRYDWQGWADERPVTFQQKVVQVPKFWSSGKLARLCYFSILKCVLEMERTDFNKVQDHATLPS